MKRYSISVSTKKMQSKTRMKYSFSLIVGKCQKGWEHTILVKCGK